MSRLHQVLSEYSVPLQVWLTPEARGLVADVLFSALGEKAQIVSNPLAMLDSLRGPAVLVLTASELDGGDQDRLRALAQRAHPGRAVLLGGTSDRDTLMNAINNWGVVRVLRPDAESNDITSAIRAAGAHLNREVAMETAIEDLDIETTMIVSAIDQLEDGRERSRAVARTNTATTFSDGLANIVAREQAALAPLADQIEAEQHDVARRTMQGMEALKQIMEKTHDHAVEKAAGLPNAGEAIDEILTLVRTLIDPSVGGHLGSGARVPLGPYPLFHFLLEVCRKPNLGSLVSMDSHRSGERAVVTLHFKEALPDNFAPRLEGSGSISQAEMEKAGGQILATTTPQGQGQILISLPAMDDQHV